MNLEQKIGQLLVVGFDGTEVTEDIKYLIQKYHVGNIILFEKNCKDYMQIKTLINELQKLALESNGVPLFISIDQENGMVTRIFDGVTVFPGNMAQSAGANLEEIYLLGKYVGEDLKALGINFNLAPSVDINNNPLNPVIGVRSYGETAGQVAECAKAYVKGIQEEGIYACAKHFPGHGNTSTDTHLDLPTVNSDKAQLEEVELYPFKELIKSGVKAIMTTHIKFPAYETENLPATLSYNILTKLLRETLGFDGLIITDCMEMKAIATYYGTSNAVSMAICAGADLVCVSHTKQTQIESIEKIKEYIKDGKLTLERIDNSVNKILKAKEGFNYQFKKEALAQKISEQSITIVKNNGLIPLEDKNILIVAPNAKVFTGADAIKNTQNFAKLFKEKSKYKNVTAVEIDNIPKDEQVEEIKVLASKNETIIICTYNASLIPKQIELIKEVCKINKNIILIPMRNPYDIEKVTEVNACVLPYEYTNLSMMSLIKVLQGDINAKGKLPVSINLN